MKSDVVCQTSKSVLQVTNVTINNVAPLPQIFLKQCHWNVTYSKSTKLLSNRCGISRLVEHLSI